jgi:hypothetical protein
VIRSVVSRSVDSGNECYALAPMCRPIAVTTAFVLALPIVFGIVAIKVGWPRSIAPLGLCVVFIMACFVVWTWFRPKLFIVSHDFLTIQWLLRKKVWKKSAVLSAKIISSSEFRKEYGMGMRIGAGGLWGGFGLLKTSSCVFRMYISRTDEFVLVHLRNDHPLLITPEQPQDFIRYLFAPNGA